MRLGLRGHRRSLGELEGCCRTRTHHPSTPYSMNKGRSRRTPSLSSYSDICHWLLCLQYGCRQPSIFYRPVGQALGPGKSVVKNPRKPQAEPLPQSIGEECSQLDSEKRSVEGSQPRCCPRCSGCRLEWASMFPRSCLRGEIPTLMISFYSDHFRCDLQRLMMKPEV